MILTPLDHEALSRALDAVAANLSDDLPARTAFARIADTRRFCPDLAADLRAGCCKAVELATRLGIETLDADPADAYSWDGKVIRTRSESSVVFHEIAHWKLTPPHRRSVLDFGLGAGPETGLIAQADGAICTDAATREEEESLASLLGILWEVANDEPALLAFAEQNWLELPDRLHTARHFTRCVHALRERRLIGADGRPLLSA